MRTINQLAFEEMASSPVPYIPRSTQLNLELLMKLTQSGQETEFDLSQLTVLAQLVDELRAEVEILKGEQGGGQDGIPPSVFISPVAGSYVGQQYISLSANENSVIYYTLDGSIPTISSQVYMGPFSITETTTIRFFAKDATGNVSGISTATYTITIPDTTPPVVSVNPGPGTFTSVQTVTLSANEAAAIYYTTDGSTPTTLSTLYSVPLNIAESTTLKYIAKDSNGNQTSVQSAVYTINLPDTTAPTVNISPVAGTYTSVQSVTLSANESATIYYTLNGTTPTINNGTVYSGPITVSESVTIRFFARDLAGNESGVQSAAYTINLPDTTAPTVSASPSAGTYTSVQSVTLSADESSTIYYTTNGNVPTTSSSVYSNPIPVSSTTTIRFFARDAAGNESAIQTNTYTINIPDTTAPTVTASPVAGTYTSAQSVTLTANETATIYYTLDGSTPTTSSSVYSAPINISETKTLRYFARDTAGNESAVQSSTYTINIAAGGSYTYGIPTTTTKSASGTSGWKGSSVKMLQTKTLTEIGLGGNSAPSTVEIWSLTSSDGTYSAGTTTFNAKLVTGTFSGTKDAGGYYTYTLSTPLVMNANSHYMIVANNTAAGVGFIGRASGTSNATLDATIALMPNGSGPFSAGNGTTNNYCYDWRFAFQ